MDKNKKRKVEQSALKHMSKGVFNKAIKDYTVLLKFYPDELTYLKQIAKCYENMNQPQEALRYYTRLTSNYKKKGLYKQAIAIYSIMMNLGETREEIYDDLAFCYKEINRAGDATLIYRKLLENYMKKALFRSAISVASKILAINPEDTIAIINAAEAQLQLNEKDRSIEMFKIAAQIYKKQNNLAMYTKILGRINHVSGNSDAKTLNELASIYIIQRNYGEQLLELLLKSYRISKEAKDDSTLIETTKLLVTFFKETNQRKQMLSIRFELAKIYERIGEKEKALETYNKILQIAPGSQDVRKRAKELQVEINKLNEVKEEPHNISLPTSSDDENKTVISRPIPKKEVTISESELKNILREVDTYIKFKLYAKAEPILKDLYKKYPKISSVTKRLREIYIKTHKIEQAVELLFDLFESSYKEDKDKAREYLEEIIYIDSENKKANKYIEKFYDKIPSTKNQNSVAVDIDIDEPDVANVNDLVNNDEIIETITIDDDSLSIVVEDDYDLEQIKFYISQGMYDNAKHELDNRLKISPNDPELLELLSELEQAVKPIIIDDSLSGSNEEIQEDVDDILKQFKKGIDESISKDDAKTRYDLGIAYKAMGLLDDAINEFKLVYKHVEKKGDCLLMIGLCYNDKAEFDKSIKYFKKALEYSENLNQKLAIYYEIANAYDLLGNLKHAFSIFKKISQKDKGFRDAYKRLKQLHVKLKVDKDNISYL